MTKSCFGPWLAFAAIPLLAATSAHAGTNLVSYVSATGNDNTSCSTPGTACSTISGALPWTTPGGEIVLVGPISTSGTNINQAVTIRASGNDVTVIGGLRIEAGATDKIEFDGLNIFGGGPSRSIDFGGVRIYAAGEVFIRNCHIRGFLLVNNLVPTAGVFMRNTAKSVRVTIDGTVITDNLYGIAVESAPNMGHIKLFNSMILSNPSDGIKITGAGNDVIIANSQILGSPKALDLVAGASAVSYGNNVITNGDMPAQLPLN